MKGLLAGNKEDFKYIMLEEHFDELKGNLVKHMIAQVYENQDNGLGDNGGREGGKRMMRRNRATNKKRYLK